MRLPTVILLAGFALWAGRATAQTPTTAREMYHAWCATCHADDGAGKVAGRIGTKTPLDFTNCRLATPESDADWQLVISRGGAAAGLSFDMPAFEALTAEQVTLLIDHLRSFCREPGWPIGNVNLPRALFTAKAFPDDEFTIKPVVSHSPDIFPYIQMEGSYSRRIGRRGHAEISLPLDSVDWVTGRVTGIGDVAIEGGYVVHTNEQWTAIATAGMRATFPSGSRRWGFGEGTTSLEPYLATGAVWRGLYLQTEIRARFLMHQFEKTDRTRILNFSAAVSHDLSTRPSTWNIGLEVNLIDSGVSITPQVRKGLTRTGALAAALGVQIPLRAPYLHFNGTTRWAGYLVWDYLETIRHRRR